jgi:hypothetical protein
MTNREKFKEVFGFKQNEKECVAPEIICQINNNECLRCPFRDWWDREYKSCFILREDLQKEV